MSKMTFGIFAALVAAMAVTSIALADTQSAAPAPTASTPASSAAQTMPNTPAPAQLNIAFDQVDRLIVGAATPPPINAFSADLAAAKDAQNSSGGINMPHGPNIGDMVVNEIPVIGSIFSMANAAKQQAAAKKQMQEEMAKMSGDTYSITNYAFFNGWSRVQTGNSVIITKPDQHVTIFLDTKAKTYRKYDSTSAIQTQETVASTTAAPSTETPTTGVPAASAAATPESGQATATAMISVSQADQATIDGQQVTGYSAEALVTLTDSTGSCHDGTFRAKRLEYFAQLPEPTQSHQQAVDSLALPNGCNVNVTRQTSGLVPPSGLMYVYRATTVVRDAQAATQAPSSNGMPDPAAMMQHFSPAGGASAPTNYVKVSERGNIRQLSDADAQLFDVPADYTEDK